MTIGAKESDIIAPILVCYTVESHLRQLEPSDKRLPDLFRVDAAFLCVAEWYFLPATTSGHILNNYHLA